MAWFEKNAVWGCTGHILGVMASLFCFFPTGFVCIVDHWSLNSSFPHYFSRLTHFKCGFFPPIYSPRWCMYDLSWKQTGCLSLLVTNSQLLRPIDNTVCCKAECNIEQNVTTAALGSGAVFSMRDMNSKVAESAGAGGGLFSTHFQLHDPMDQHTTQPPSWMIVVSDFGPMACKPETLSDLHWEYLLLPSTLLCTFSN